MARATFEAVWALLQPRLLSAGRRTELGEHPRTPILLGVDGRSGSGKTDLADRLAVAVRGLGLSCSVVHLDDMYQGWDGLGAVLEPLCAEVVGPLTSGRDGSHRTWNWADSVPGPRVRVATRDVMVLEGVGVLAAPCANQLDLRLWLDAPAGVRHRRALDRDGDTFAPHWRRWAEQEDRLYGDAVPACAQMVVDTVAATAQWDTLGP